MNRRASWRGHLTFADFNCEIGLYSALTSAEKIAFNIVNRKTGHRVERQYVDSDTGEAVLRDDQVKGYELDNGDHIVIEGDEIAKLMPESDKVIRVSHFLPCDEIDKLYFDKSYYLAPGGEGGEEALTLLARAMDDENVAALGEAVLFRRNRVLLIRPSGKALVATTLNFSYEVRSQTSVFKSIPDIEFDEEMLELAGHIIEKRAGTFDPADYSDRYNDALAELVKAKIEGREITKQPPRREDNIIDLKEALRRSAGAGADSKKKATAAGRKASRKAS
ncbi:DNA end-binding protein Ku [Agrobacterium tumefaciens]|jgi:DNA end-binding protein Ku|uniref:Non-homologous end joining protein Ku n=2 Tax=Agrobacterium tumefaciens complex TaxID=1183400 RepID=A0AAW8LY23_AGRTU|nr:MULTISPECIES: Ku protein [Agrobacterium tumefaciens complex]TGE78465.1 Ku protein [Rhizobium sp. SEMIA 439]KAA1232874.1 Ku protein [Agrobacterium tumefaciens]MBB4283425.1 DNA end-binding protein Ku [Agrobacterium radiobacter]MBB4320995.1 DNA end-binding protein Ku [Agrobacterium radiobacter]MBB4325356.1 DNA end-binding protein Ku [Agrobacterium radiobacter]